jgi:hypothetical protein
MLKNNTHKIFISSTTLDYLQNSWFLRYLFLFRLEFDSRPENFGRFYIIKLFLLILSKAIG